MQATLLGLGIAIILALVAALVGPYFIDWSAHRALFETNVSRLAGMPVRINGAIDVRMLPTPSLVLRDVEAGASQAEGKLKAGEAAVELALGPLMRGEWRATEVRLVRPEFALRLDQTGRFSWSGTAPAIDPDAVSVERFSLEDGRVLLSDEASATSLSLDAFWFNGDLRSLIGPFKGEGGFLVTADHYGFRIAAGRGGDDGLKIKLNLDPSDRQLTAEADGMLRLERGVPRFDGALTFARPAGLVVARGHGVSTDFWRATSRVKLNPSGGLLEQIEVQHGPEERSIKLAGTAQVVFGKGARLDGVVSARQIDLDRAFPLPEGTRRVPLAVLRRAADAFAGVLSPPIPVRLGVSIDSATLAGAALQTVRADLASNSNAWNLETLEFRAPGSTQVRASGRLTIADGATFTGPAVIEASDPKAMLGWLEGRTETPQGPTGSMRANGDLTLGADRIAVERLSAEVDRKSFSGRLAYSWAAQDRPARVDAALTAAELDIDQALAFVRAASAGTSLDAPGEAELEIDIANATIAGVEAKGTKAKLSFDAKGFVLDRVAVADLRGAALDLNGRLDSITTSPRGTLTLDIDASRFDGVAAVLARYAPRSAEALRATAPRLMPAKLSALLTVDRADGGSRAELVVTGKAGATRLNITGDATGDVNEIMAAEVNLNSRIFGDDAAALLALAGLDKAIAVDKRSGSFTLTATGRLGELAVEARGAAPRMESNAKGTLHLFGPDVVAGELDLRLAAADALLLRRSAADDPVPITMRTRLGIKGNSLSFENIAGVVAGTGVRGRLGVVLGQPNRLDGRLELDALDLAALGAMAAGAPVPAAPSAASRNEVAVWSSEPFVPGAFADVTGQVAFEAQRAALTPNLAAEGLRGVFRIAEGEVHFEDFEARVGGGRAIAQLTLRAAPDGVTARGRLDLSDADLSMLLPGEIRPMLQGRLGLQMETEGNGLSPATLVGSLRGAGTVTLDGAQVAGLNAKAFETVIRAVDRSVTIDAAKVRDLMDAALQAGRLSIPHVDGAFSLGGGQARWGNVVARADGADLSLSGVVDFSQALVDARLSLSGAPDAANESAGRPEVFIALKGPLAAPKRTIDVAALTGWLTLRAVERQSKQIEQLRARQEATVGTTPPATATPPASSPTAATPPDTLIPTAPSAPLRLPEGGAESSQPAPEPAPAAPPRRALAPTAPPMDMAPALPPPVEIRPVPDLRAPTGNQRPTAGATPTAPKARANNPPRAPAEAPPAAAPPAAASRSILDQLFGPQR